MLPVLILLQRGRPCALDHRAGACRKDFHILWQLLDCRVGFVVLTTYSTLLTWSICVVSLTHLYRHMTCTSWFIYTEPLWPVPRIYDLPALCLHGLCLWCMVDLHSAYTACACACNVWFIRSAPIQPVAVMYSLSVLLHNRWPELTVFISVPVMYSLSVCTVSQGMV